MRELKDDGRRGGTRHFAATLCVLALALAAGCGGRRQAQDQAALPVKIEVAQAARVNESTDYVATLKSRESAAIMPQVEGHVTRILVRSGDQVAAGSPLLEIDPSKQQATLKSQEDTRSARLASLEFAKQQYERAVGLAAAGIMSRQDLDQAKSALDAAQAEVQSLDAQVREQQVQLQYYRVSAPADGVVGDIPVRVGDRVTVSTLLTTLDRPGSLEAYVSVPVERAAQLRIGLPVQILNSLGEIAAESRVTFVSPQVDNSTQTVLAKARIENTGGSLRNAQFIRARVVWETHERPVIPVLAVSRISGQYFAFVAENQGAGLLARQRPIRVGEIVDNHYTVLEGLKVGDRIIVSGTQMLADGVPVSPQS